MPYSESLMNEINCGVNRDFSDVFSAPKMLIRLATHRRAKSELILQLKIPSERGNTVKPAIQQSVGEGARAASKQSETKFLFLR